MGDISAKQVDFLTLLGMDREEAKNLTKIEAIAEIARRKETAPPSPAQLAFLKALGAKPSDLKNLKRGMVNNLIAKLKEPREPH